MLAALLILGWIQRDRDRMNLYTSAPPRLKDANVVVVLGSRVLQATSEVGENTSTEGRKRRADIL